MAGMEPSPPESLLKYDAPLFTEEKDIAGGTTPTEKQTKKDKNASQMDDILNAILPPRAWKEESGNWMQYTSSTPSTRLDVIQLQEEMDATLVSRQARDTGICPVREDVFSQCFDEIIRQVTINGAERGLLLLRVRDEAKMTLDAYRTLYDSSVTFGIRKQLQAEQGVDDLEEKINQLTKEKEDNENRVLELSNKVELIEKRALERRTLLDKKRKAEVDFLKYQGQHLDTFLKSTAASSI